MSLTAVLAWLTGSRLGKWVAVGVLAAVAVGAVVQMLRAGAVKGERARQVRAQLDRTMETLDAVRKMDAAQRGQPRTRRELLERLREGSG